MSAEPRPLNARSLGLALLITLIWGVNFVVIKWSVAGASPLLVAALRFAVAAVPAVFFVPRPRMPARLLWSYGLAVGVVQFGLLYLAVQLGLSAGMGSLLMQTQAFFTALLAARLLGERVLPWQALGMTLAFGGMGLIGLVAGGDVPLFPLLLTLTAALGWAVSNLIVKAAPQANGFHLVVWSALIPPLPLTGLALLTSGPGEVWHTLTHSSPAFWAAILFMGLANTVLGFGLWANLIGQHGASRVAPLSLLVPVFGMLASALVFQEGFPPGKVVGAALVFTGLMLHVFGGRWWWRPA
ncbi:O-acetylserine/cysteine efflux transporter [Deinococcus reticulitermitis]|uniref:O-acetylserine/cysteine efflux transporter n=1 Tax=Deinococcus reticulitermitis TaxID=856736 RepID=A0A1H7CMJ2_9DEIO|nr:EamA family transporter [Deinococcus reticulitermitis]SEJ88352.1 O-acetylserine/cysteine efflux transporter [Deinococcus reticulitermitis]